MSESTTTAAESHAVAGAPGAAYTDAMAAVGRIPWWRDLRLFWVPVTSIALVFFIYLWGIQREVGELRGEVAALRGEFRAETAELRAEFQEQMGDLGQRITRIETLLEALLEEQRARNPESEARDPEEP